MSRITVETPDGPERVHLLQEEVPLPPDPDVEAISAELQEMRKWAVPAAQSGWMFGGLAFAACFSGIFLERWNINWEVKLGVMVAGAIVTAFLFSWPAEPGREPHGLESEMLALRRRKRQAVRERDELVADRVNTKERYLMMETIRRRIHR